MAAYLAIRQQRRFRSERIRKDPFIGASDEDLIREYRLSKAAITELCTILENDLKPKYQGKNILTVEQQVLISLKQLASGSFQNSKKDNLNVSQPTVSKVFSNFMESLISKKERFIYMPSSMDMLTAKQQFYSMARFTAVIGAIDGQLLLQKKNTCSSTENTFIR